MLGLYRSTSCKDFFPSLLCTAAYRRLSAQSSQRLSHRCLPVAPLLTRRACATPAAAAGAHAARARRQVAWLDEARGPRDRGISADDVHVDLEDVGALRVVDRQLVLGEVVASADDPLGQVGAPPCRACAGGQVGQVGPALPRKCVRGECRAVVHTFRRL